MDNEFIPLSVPSLKGNELKYVTDCIETEWVSSVGTYVSKFEKKVAEYVGTKYAVACVNGTAALHIGLILSGVSYGDEVIAPTLTFIAPINTIKYVGASPVFMDCDEYLNIDVKKVEEFCKNECRVENGVLINNKSNCRIKAIIAVHIFGHPVDMLALKKVADKYKLKIIEDASESLGSYYSYGELSGKYTGVVGDIGCFSFNGNKIITTGGGGMLVTSDPELAERARHLMTQAKEDSLYYIHDEIGYNYRLTNIQAAIGVAQMEELEQFIQIKRDNFTKYKEAFLHFENISLIEEPHYSHSNYWYYTLYFDEADKRDFIMKSLKHNNIESRPLWQLNHLQKPYEHCQSYEIDKAFQNWKRCLNIPCSVNLKHAELLKVVSVINKKMKK